MNQINELPEPTDAGLEFDYSNWEANTEVTLCNVTWDNTNSNILSRSMLANLDAYIDSLQGNDTYNNVVPIRVNEPISIDKPYNVASRYNYLRAKHPAKPVPGNDIPMTYYYFIIGFVEDSPNSTRILLQLDVWATYGRYVSFKSAFVERGHIGIANENQFQNNGMDYLTIPEGLDLGSNYITKWASSYPLYQLSNAAVLVASNTDLEKPWFDGEFPVKRTPTGSAFTGMPTGVGFWVFQSTATFKAFMSEVSGAPHIANGIINITLIPEFSNFWPSFTWDNWPEMNRAPESRPQRVTKTFFNNWRELMRTAIPEQYRHLNKFRMYPYTVLEFTSFAGSVIHIRPERWLEDNVTVELIVGLMPPNQRVVVVPKNYNKRNAGLADIYGDFIDTALVIGNFPSLPMVNDAGALYLAQNARSIAQSVDSAEWTRDKSLRGAQVSYNQATVGMDASRASVDQSNYYASQQNDISQRYAWADAATGSIEGIGTGAGMGALAGPGGMAAGAAGGAFSAIGRVTGTAFGVAKANEQLAAGIANSQAQNDISRGAGTYMRDTNADLARYSAQGDYENTIAGIMAKVQDAKISPNSVIGSFGGESLNLINNIDTLVWRGKMIDDAHIRKIGDYWNRYGYAVEAYIDTLPADMMCMTRFTYWKVTETYLDASPMPELFKQAIRGIFEKGVTVWNHPDMIGSFRNNQPLEGISY